MSASGSGRPRSTGRRIGLAGLNLLLPGLGLLRIGRPRRALPWLASLPAYLLLLAALSATLPTVTFVAFTIVAGLSLMLLAVVLAVPIADTWRLSRIKAPARLSSRWPVLLLCYLLVVIAANASAALLHRLYKPFHMPSDSMAPTVAAGDRLLADMRGGREPRHGDIVVFRHGGEVRIARVAALAGERIAMRNGVPMIDGHPAEHRHLGSDPDRGDDRRAARIAERLPGEATPHDILDDGHLPQSDHMPEVIVPAGHVFVLGDDRDRSADSRYAPEQGGVATVPLAHIIGRPLFIYWSSLRARIGRSLLPQRP